MPILRQTVQVISKIFTPAKARQQRFCPGTQNCKIHRKIFCRAAARAAAAQWELPPFSGLVKRVTPDFYSTSWTFLNPSSTSSSTTNPSFTTISSSTTTTPFLRLVKCTTLSLYSVSWALLDPQPFRFNKLSTVAKCSLDIFQFANTRNLTKSEMCLELLLYEKAK